MSKILFIYPNIVGSENISLGIAYLSAALKENGHSTLLFDMTFQRSKKKLSKMITDYGPDYIAFSARSGEYKHCLNLAKFIVGKFGREIPLLIGGPHASASIDIDPFIFDFQFVGEADKSLPWFVKHYDNLGSNCLINEIPISDLDSLPYPDYDLFDMGRYLDILGGLEVISSRGCLFRCSFCIHGAPYAPRFRQKSVKYFVKELNHLANRYKIDNFFFQDDMFTANKKWITEFAEAMKENQFTFTCNARPETIKEDVAKNLKIAGCTMVNIGIESGSKEVRYEVLNRRIRFRTMLYAFKCAKNCGLKTYSYNMIGLPNETKIQVKRTIVVNQRIQPDYLQVSVFQPYVGTALHDSLVAAGKPISYNYSHQLLPKYNYANYSRFYLRYLKATMRFRILRKHQLLKAIWLLFYDTFFPLLTPIRRLIPKNAKKLFLRMVR